MVAGKPTSCADARRMNVCFNFSKELAVLPAGPDSPLPHGGGAFYQWGDLLELHLRQSAACHAFAEAGQRLRNALPCVGLRFLSLSLAILCIGLRNQNHVSMSTVTATTTVS